MLNSQQKFYGLMVILLFPNEEGKAIIGFHSRIFIPSRDEDGHYNWVQSFKQRWGKSQQSTYHLKRDNTEKAG